MKIRNFIVLGLIGLLVGISSCRDDFDFDISSGNLSFSADTLNLDTIFNFTNSQTYKLTVHNNQDEDVVIPRIYLTGGETSLFKLNVDGIDGNEAENVAIRKNDSIFIFVEIGAGEVPVNSNYEDEINFETSGGSQQVKLLSYLEKAKFYNTELIDDYPLTETNWNNEWSRVIFGNVTAQDLTITAGTKVYFHNDANLNVNGRLIVDGDFQNEVVFRTDRMDERSDSLPDMWGKIYLKSPNNSDLNSIDYAVIRSGNIGLEVEDSKLEINNSKILNNEKIGLYAHGTSNVTGKNLVINNSDLASLAIEGGTHKFTQCTFANYHNIGQGTGDNYSLWLSPESPVQAEFYNSIFYGNHLNAIQIDEGSGNYTFEYNVIRNDTEMNFSPTNITDEDPMFVNPGFGANDLRLLQNNESSIPGHGNPAYIINDNILENDILGYSRLPNPTPGAYQNPVVPED